MTTADFIGEVISTLGFTENITNATFSQGETTLETCLTHHVFPCYKIEINGTMYKVVDVEHNMSITVKGDASGATEYTIPPPFYFHGTPLQASNELAMPTRWRTKLPFWYLIEPFNNNDDDDPMSKVAKTPRLRMLILFPIGDLGALVEDQYKELILPASNAVDDFRNALNKHPRIAKIRELYQFNTRNRVNWGVYVTKKGQSRKANEDNIKKMIDEDVTGIEVELQIPIKKDLCRPKSPC